MEGQVPGWTHNQTRRHPLPWPRLASQVNGMQTAAAGSGGSLLMRLGVGAALRHVARTEGLAALWKGNGVTIIHRLPYSATNFWVYEHVNELWKRHIPSQGAWAAGDVARRLVAGGVAGMSACALVSAVPALRPRLRRPALAATFPGCCLPLPSPHRFAGSLLSRHARLPPAAPRSRCPLRRLQAYPLDLVRTRLAAQTTRSYYMGIGHALRTIVADEGARGLYRGLGPTLLQVRPSRRPALPRHGVAGGA